MLLRKRVLAPLVVITVMLLAAAKPLPATSAEQTAAKWPWPLLGEVITPYKNGDDRYAAGQHRGIDIAAAIGADVRAVVAGKVTYAGRLPDGGNAVTISDEAGRYLVSYLHLSTRAVSRGEKVTVGTKLGVVGTTGRRSAEPSHLHFGVRTAASREYVDPATLLGPLQLAQLPAPQVAIPDAAEQNSSPAKSPAVADPESKSGAESEKAQDRAAERPATRTTPVASRPAATSKPSEARSRRVRARAAPPPVAEKPERLDHDTATDERRVGSYLPTEVHPRAEGAEDGFPRRTLLLLIAACCVAALWVRRRPTPREDHGGDPGAIAVDPPQETSAPELEHDGQTTSAITAINGGIGHMGGRR